MRNLNRRSPLNNSIDTIPFYNSPNIPNFFFWQLYLRKKFYSFFIIISLSLSLLLLNNQQPQPSKTHTHCKPTSQKPTITNQTTMQNTHHCQSTTTIKYAHHHQKMMIYGGGDQIDRRKKPNNPSMPHFHIQPSPPLDQCHHHQTTTHKT